jgi:hypothetical protein
LERVPIFRNPITQAHSGLSSHRQLKGVGADLNPLPWAEPAGGAGLSPPANARAAAQVYAENSLPKLLQVGMPSANRSVFEAKTAMLIPADQDEGVLKDAPLAICPAWA